MRSLNSTGITPPGGFRWRCAETGAWVPAIGNMPSYTDFIYECKKHCVANNLPMGLQWESKIQEQLCIGLDSEFCNEGGFPIPPVGGFGFNVAQVTEGTRFLGQKMREAKVRRIPEEESTARAAICVDCAMNQSPIGCSTCNSVAMNDAANSVAEGQIGVHDARLRSCKVSGFSLKAKINVPLDILKANLTDGQMSVLPEKCWLNDL